MGGATVWIPTGFTPVVYWPLRYLKPQSSSAKANKPPAKAGGGIYSQTGATGGLVDLSKIGGN